MRVCTNMCITLQHNNNNKKYVKIEKYIHHTTIYNNGVNNTNAKNLSGINVLKSRK